MLRIHLMQNWFGYSDPAMEEALYEITVLRQFAGLSLDKVPDETTILHFRHLLDAHELAVPMLSAVNGALEARGLLMRQGTIVDATIIHAPTLNPEGLACEVQIRTLLQHAHSELTHDTLYKPKTTAKPSIKRTVAKSMALIEATDEFFEQAMAEAVELVARHQIARIGDLGDAVAGIVGEDGVLAVRVGLSLQAVEAVVFVRGQAGFAGAVDVEEFTCGHRSMVSSRKIVVSKASRNMAASDQHENSALRGANAAARFTYTPYLLEENLFSKLSHIA